MFGMIASAVIFPFSWVLQQAYAFSHSYGLTIIIFSLIIKLVLLPVSVKMKKSSLAMSRLSPKMKELEKRYKGDQQKYAEEVQKLYAEENVNPLSGCLWGFIPLPIMIILYAVIQKPLTNFMRLTAAQITAVSNTLAAIGVSVSSSGTYGEIHLAQKMFENFDVVKAAVPEVFKLNFTFLGVNLSQVPQWNWFITGDFSWNAIGLFLIPIISGVCALFSSVLSMSMNNNMKDIPSTSKSMLYTMPLVSVWMGFVLPASLGIYWIANSVFTIIQEFFLNKYFRKVFAEQDRKRKEAEEDARARGLEKQAEVAAIQSQQSRNGQKQNNNKKKQLPPSQKKGQQPKMKNSIEGKLGDRPYARGRAYVADRFGPGAGSGASVEQPGNEQSGGQTEQAPTEKNGAAEAEQSREK